MLASYNEKDGFTGLLSSLKKLKEIKPISEEVSKCFSTLNESAIKAVPSIKALFDDYKINEQSALDFAQGIKDGSIQLKNGQTMLQGYQSYLQSTTKSLSLANLGTKALTVSMKVFSTIGWMAIMGFASKAIGKGIEWIDDYIHRVERANEAMNDAV